MNSFRRIAAFALVLALAAVTCDVTCAATTPPESCCCGMLDSAPCEELSVHDGCPVSRDDDAVEQSSAQTTPIVLPVSAAPPELDRTAGPADERTEPEAAFASPPLFLNHCRFLC
ncbi:MAG: hypothetical protein GY856_35575 [bacterium]|nr:hypothetical protein [bacterium]